MKKETLLEIILGTIGGLIFALGMCMCLMTEWNLLKSGIVLAVIGLVILLGIVPIYRKSHPKKEHRPINGKAVIAWIIGIAGALLMGFGMSKIMHGEISTSNMIIGLITGMIGLIICILDYPIYRYIEENKL